MILLIGPEQPLSECKQYLLLTHYSSQLICISCALTISICCLVCTAGRMAPRCCMAPRCLISADTSSAEGCCPVPTPVTRLLLLVVAGMQEAHSVLVENVLLELTVQHTCLERW